MAKRELTGYRFLDKDPVVDLFREAKRRTKAKDVEIAAASGVTTGTLKNWDRGKTRKPQHATMRYAMAAMGYDEQFVNVHTQHVLSAHYTHTKRVKLED